MKLLNRKSATLIASVALVAYAAPSNAEVRVVTTTPTFADITRQVGGEHVSVESVMRGPENIHNVSAKPSHMMKIRRADLFVHGGLDAEPWAPLIAKGARKAEFLPGGEASVDVSAGIQLKQVPMQSQLTRAQGDIHVFGNTHYGLDPLNGIRIARTIADALSREDPGHSSDFESNFAAFAQRIEALTRELTQALAPYLGRNVVTYHRSWPYFLERFGLVTIGEVEPKPGITPSPQHLNRMVQLMQSSGADVVIVETYSSRRNAQSLAQRAGGQAIVLGVEVKAQKGVDSYEDLFRTNVQTIIDAFQSADESAGRAP